MILVTECLRCYVCIRTHHGSSSSTRRRRLPCIYIVHSNTYLSSEAAAASAAVHCAGGCITQSHRRRCSFQLKQPSVRPFFLPPFPPPTLTTAFVVSRSNVNVNSTVCSNLSLSFPTTHNSTLHSGSNVPLPKFCN